MNTQHLNVLKSCEAELAQAQPFGDWQSIISRNLTFYEKGVSVLAPHTPLVAKLAEQIGRATNETKFYVFGHPSVRTALNDLLQQFKKSGSAIPNGHTAVIETATKWLAEGACSNRQDRNWISLPPHRALVWNEGFGAQALEESFGELFSREIAPSISSRPAVLRAPTDQMLQTLKHGCQLLDQLLPVVGRSTMAHVHIIGIVDVSDRSKWEGKLRADLCQSVSTHAIPGTIFLSPSVLRTPYHAAEALFHEAGHKKLSDLVFTRSIFRSGYSEKNSPLIRALWNRSLSWNSADWSIDRALFACHVYVHLGLFFSALSENLAGLQSQYGPLDGMNPAASARGGYNRARYLIREIQNHSNEALGDDGKAFVKWLDQVLTKLDPNPPVQNPDVHLWLDRFDRETREVGTLISLLNEAKSDQGDSAPTADYKNWSARRLVHHLVHSEIVSAYRILSTLGEQQPPSFAFYDGDRWSTDAASACSLSELGNVFSGMRTFTSKTLRRIRESEYARPCRTTREKTLKDLVVDATEHAGRHIDDLTSQVRAQRRQDQASNEASD